MPDQISEEQMIANAGPDTLRRMLSIEKQKVQRMQELLQFARTAARSAAGNLVALDEKVTSLFKEVAGKT